jgi:hypothetical protein
MPDVHPFHGTAHSWKGFLIEIATIVTGLIIAVGLDQTVEHFRHQYQIRQIEQGMREVFASNLRSDATNFRQLLGLRAYLSALRGAIDDRLHGRPAQGAPPFDDARMATIPVFPSLAPYEAAKTNGTVALLSNDRIGIYNRVAFARELLWTVRDRWFDGLAALAAFHKRYVDSTGSLELGEVVPGPEVKSLAAAELTEYLKVVSDLIQKTDLFYARMHLFDVECRYVLSGVRSEEELNARLDALKRGSYGPPATLIQPR